MRRICSSRWLERAAQPIELVLELKIDQALHRERSLAQVSLESCSKASMPEPSSSERRPEMSAAGAPRAAPRCRARARSSLMGSRPRRARSVRSARVKRLTCWNIWTGMRTERACSARPRRIAWRIQMAA
jgi:hypothetical protein